LGRLTLMGHPRGGRFRKMQTGGNCQRIVVVATATGTAFVGDARSR
jgi:hypothetical protein